MKSYIIVGAGILGASTAYHLAKSGARVTVIDRKEPGQATDAASGIVCPWLSQRRNQDWYQLAKGGARYYKDLIHQLEKTVNRIQDTNVSVPSAFILTRLNSIKWRKGRIRDGRMLRKSATLPACLQVKRKSCFRF